MSENLVNIKHDALPQAMYDSRWHERLMGWLASLTLEDEAKQELSMPWVIYEYEDVFFERDTGITSVYSMGRGRVQGSQAGNSGTQGRVYAIPPQTKSAD